jgi:HAE1 family hydrophobic/amphiphilic exporter-1
VALVLVIAPATAQAQPSVQAPSAPARILTLDEALAIAAQENRDVQRAREYQRWVHGKYLQERSAALPNVTFDASAARQFDDTQSKLFRDFSFGGDSGSEGDGAQIGEIFGGRQDARSVLFNVTQPVFTWGQVGAAIRAAKIGYQYADYYLRRFQHAVTKDVSTAYYDVVLAKAIASIADEDLAQKERHLEEARKKASAGAATDYDILAAQVTAENARPAVIRAQNLVRLAKDRLRFLLAEPAAEIDVAPPPPVTIQPPRSYDEVLAQALQNRPEVGEITSQRDIYRELVTISKAGNKPRVDFAAGLGKRSLGLPSISSTGTLWSAAIVARVPLFDGMRTRGLVAQAETDLSRAEIDQQQLREAIGLEVRNAVAAAREAGEIVVALQGTVKQAEQLVFLSEKGYELGVKIRLEVQDAELNLLQARGNLARAEREYRVALVNLEWVSGTLK